MKSDSDMERHYFKYNPAKVIVVIKGEKVKMSIFQCFYIKVVNGSWPTAKSGINLTSLVLLLILTCKQVTNHSLISHYSANPSANTYYKNQTFCLFVMPGDTQEMALNQATQVGVSLGYIMENRLA